jgi:hypothetical protein
MFLTSLVAGDERDLHVTTGFEDWCAGRGVHPETLGAWEAYEATALVAPDAVRARQVEPG